MFDVVGLGTVLVDHLVQVARHPEVDTKHASLSSRFQVGGPVPTALAVLARFGRRCAFVGNWGDDALGDQIERDLREQGIDFGGSRRRANGATGFAHVWIEQETGRRTLVSSRSELPIEPDELEAELLKRAPALHLDGWPGAAARRAAEIVRGNGGLVSLDTGSPKPGMMELIGMVDVLNCPRRSLQHFFGSAEVEPGVQKLLAMGPRIVTVTDGEQGAWIGTPSELVFEPAFAVRAVDTNGAGDVFSGALIHAALAEWSPRMVLRFAMGAAALKCRGLGNREPLPTLEDVFLLGEAAGRPISVE